MAGGWRPATLKVPSNPGHSGILRSRPSRPTGRAGPNAVTTRSAAPTIFAARPGKSEALPGGAKSSTRRGLAMAAREPPVPPCRAANGTGPGGQLRPPPRAGRGAAFRSTLPGPARPGRRRAGQPWVLLGCGARARCSQALNLNGGSACNLR